MAGPDLYSNKGLTQSDYRKDPINIEGFDAIECDWKELFRWVISVGKGIVLEDGKYPVLDLWQDHILIVLIEIVQKDIKGYRNSFIQGRGTSSQREYTDDLRNKIEGWIDRIDRFLGFQYQADMSLGKGTAEQVALIVKKQLKNSLDVRCQFSERQQDGVDMANLPYYKMLDAVHGVKEKCDCYVDMIEKSGDMDASLALLLTFVRHYSSIIKRFNRTLLVLPAFYRNEILGVTPRAVVQDQTYVVVSPADNEKRSGFTLPARTKFLAGVTEDGNELLYSTLSREYITAMKLEKVNAVFPGKDNDEGERIHIQPINFSDLSYSSSLFPLHADDLPVVKFGWAIESSVFFLEEGKRSIRIYFLLTDKSFLSLGENKTINKRFSLQVSGSEGWIYKDTIDVAFRSERPYRLEFSCTIDAREEAISSCTDEVHGQSTRFPVVRILTDGGDSKNEWISRIEFYSVRIEVDVEGIRSLGLYNELGELDSTQPFYPFGTQAERGAWFMFGKEELSTKKWTEVTLKGLWNKLPQTDNGYTDIYSGYPMIPALTNESFKIKKEWQENERWNSCSESPAPLFSVVDGKLEEDTVITFHQKKSENRLQARSGNSYEYHRDRTGFFRVMLQEPAIGFGLETYRQLFVDVMIYNGKHKDKKQKEIPVMPVVPILSEITLSYKAFEEINGTKADDIHLSRISIPYGGEEKVDLVTQHPLVFMKNSGEEHLLYFGYLNAIGEQRISMFFDLDFVENGIPGNTANENTALPVLSFDYCKKNGQWSEPSEALIVKEGTGGLTRNGYIEVELSRPVREEWLDKNSLFWVRMHVNGDISQCLAIRSVYMNCLLVKAENGDGVSLPAGGIQKLRDEDEKVTEVVQPLPGFGGKPIETVANTSVRQSARIANRNRAVTGRDYEQIVLEQYPEIEKVYCFQRKRDSGPSEVRVVVLSCPGGCSYPITPVSKLTEIRDYLSGYISPFVPLRVCNPDYQNIEIKCIAVMKSGVPDKDVIIRRMSRRVNDYFAGWLSVGILPELGWQYSYKELHARLANDEDIVKLVKLHVNGQWIDNVDVEAEDLRIAGDTLWSILIPNIVEMKLLSPDVGVDHVEIGANFIIK